MLKNYIAAIVAGMLVLAAQFSQGENRASKKESVAMVKKAVVYYQKAGDKH